MQHIDHLEQTNQNEHFKTFLKPETIFEIEKRTAKGMSKSVDGHEGRQWSKKDRDEKEAK